LIAEQLTIERDFDRAGLKARQIDVEVVTKTHGLKKKVKE